MRKKRSVTVAAATVLIGVTLGITLSATTTQAAISSRNVNQTLSAANVDSYNLDVDQNGTTDFTFDAAYVPDPVLTVGFDQIDFPFASNNGAVIDLQTGDGFPPTSLLAPGAVISSSSRFSLSGDKADLFFYDTVDPTTGNFGGKTGYAGFRFDAADGIHYGYAQLTVNDLNTSATPLDLTIGSVAYDTTPGQAITIASVPEPVSAGIVGVAGVVTLLGRRKYGGQRRP